MIAKMTNKILKDVKVVDFGWAVAGPLTAGVLASYGAEVIKVESRLRVDHSRETPPFVAGTAWLGERSGTFANVGNAGKHSITLNLKHPRGLEVAKRLIVRADIVSENFRGGQMVELGLGYEDLKKIKPDIIMISSSIYGQTGPYGTRKGGGPDLASMSGLCELTGWSGRPPKLPIWVYTDFAVPRLAILAIIAALDYRRRTGKGQYLDFSQLEAIVQFVSPAILEYEVNGRELARIGNRSTYAAPEGVYRCKGDLRWCAITVSNDEEWRSFCQVIGKSDWAEDPELADVTGRLKNADKLDKQIEEWTISHSAEEVMSLMQGAGVPAGVVQNGEDLDNDPQLKSRNYYWELDHPALGKFAYSGMPVRLSRTPHEMKRSPCFGEHNEYVYTKLLGMSDEEFVELLREGVFE